MTVLPKLVVRCLYGTEQGQDWYTWQGFNIPWFGAIFWKILINRSTQESMPITAIP